MMELKGQTVLILGGAGLVGRAVAREVFAAEPARVVIASLRADEAEQALVDLRPLAGSCQMDAAWGDLFVPEQDRERSRAELLSDAPARARLVEDLFGELTPEVFERSALGALLLEVRPQVIVDCVNTAGALAYQNVFQSATGLLAQARSGSVDAEAVERHLATLYLPQLIRHAQIALMGMRLVGTKIYVKIGTAGTGGMGLNIPFTHSEERPSRVLLAKAGLAGAHTLLLYLMARTPDAPAVKEVKPTAAISWKSIGFGPIRRGGRAYLRSECVVPIPVATAFGPAASGFEELETPLQGVYLDAGENGLFSRDEFETLTALGLMEFITPEEIATNVLREIQSFPTGKDVVAALDAATMGPTYRAGVLRQAALSHMADLEELHGVESVAYEMLGPPRLSKLLFEAQILRRLFGSLSEVCAADPVETAARSQGLVTGDTDLRQRVLSVGVPILLPDGESVLRGMRVAVEPAPGSEEVDNRVVERGWVDLRSGNWARWRDRADTILRELADRPGVEAGSLADVGPVTDGNAVRPGQLAAWILRTEESGERIKR